MRNFRQGQSLLEYSILMIILVAALMTMQIYVKRGFQGRWKASVDDIGEQYDPRTTDGHIRHRLDATSETKVEVQEGTVNGLEGRYTVRTDTSSMNEIREGRVEVGN